MISEQILPAVVRVRNLAAHRKHCSQNPAKLCLHNSTDVGLMLGEGLKTQNNLENWEKGRVITEMN